MPDQVARKAAQQIIERFYAKDLDRGYGQNPLRMTLTEGEMAEIIESALAPMREALQAVLETRFVRIKPKLFGCQECREMGPTIEAIKHVSDCVVARAAEVLKGDEDK